MIEPVRIGEAVLSVLHSRAYWAERIGAAWRSSVEGILQTGRELIEAKAELPHGEFEAMVATELPFGSRTARRLMTVARDPRISERTHGSVLPPSWRTLYELTKLPDDQFEARIADGTIRSDMQRADLKRSAWQPPAPTQHPTEALEDLNALRGRGEKFGVIYADPPWSFRVYSGKGKQRSAERHYPTMTQADICALPVGDLAADDCALLLWAVMPQLPEALEVIKAWGFEYKTVGFTWVKTYPDRPTNFFVGMGYWTRANPELCLLATKGAPKRIGKGVEQLVVCPRGEHSSKPEIVPERIGRLVGGPYLELFARAERPGWTVWGNDIRPRLFDKAMEAAE